MSKCKIMSCLEQYQKICKPLRQQLKKVSHIFVDDKDVRHSFHQLLSQLAVADRDKNEIRRKLLRLSIFQTISPKLLLTPNFVNLLTCYSDDGAIIPLLKIIQTNRHSVVFEGRLADLPVVVKWYQSSKRDCRYELGMYQRLAETKCELPWFSDKFKFWDHPVIVMERLYPLAKYDDEYKMGVSILQQLKHLHTFGVHCDIKPGNIMRRISGTAVTYLLIDYGGVTTEKMGHGFHRWLWSPKWTSQPDRKKDSITTAKNDFLELTFTMKAVQNWRTHKGDGECHTGFTGRLKKYIDRVKKVNSHSIKDSDYDDLINILTRK